MTARTVVVTGGNRGIGRACVDAFVADGHRVASLSRSGAEVDGALSVACDVDDRTAVDAAYEQWVRAKCPGIHAAEFRVRRKDGEYVWLRDQTRLAFVTPDGRHSAIGVLVDVTERKQAERTLRESEARFRGLFENSGSCVAVYEATANGADFVFRDFNQAAERAERTSREDILGRSVLEVFPGVREFGLFEVLQRVWRTGTPERHPVSWYEDNRIAGWRDNYVYRLPSGDVVAVYEDATERKLAEQALRDAAAQWQTTFDGINDAVCILTPQGGDSALQPHDGPTAGPDAGIARRPAMPLRGPRHDGAAGRLPACPGPEFACPRAVRDRNRRPDGRSDR